MTINPSTNFFRQYRSSILIFIIVATVVLSNGYSSFQNYRISMEMHKSRLTELVLSQVILIESVAKFGFTAQGDEASGKEATLAQVFEALKSFQGIGDTSEFVIAQKKGDFIEFLNFKGMDLRKDQKTVVLPLSENFGEPMRLALEGKQGWVIALDYEGEEVLAAYAPITSIKLGLVAKMDLWEIQAPLVSSFIEATFIAFILSLLASLFVLRVINPLVVDLQQEVVRRIKDQRVLALQKSSLTKAQAIAHIGNWEWDNTQHLFTFSKELYKLLGIEKGEEAGTTSYEDFLDFIHIDDLANFKYCLDMTLSENQSFNFKHRIVRKSGEVLFVKSSGEVVFDDYSMPISMTGVMQDITTERRNQQRLSLLAKVFQEAQEAVVITNQKNRIIEVNPSFERITGYTFEEVEGQNPKRMSSGKHRKDFYLQMWESIAADGFWEGEIWDRRKNGEPYPKYLTITKINDETSGQTNYLGVFSDITQRKEAEEKLQTLAYFDALTGLANRTHFITQLKDTLNFAEREQHKVALLFLDLDHFKQVNDTLGHNAGDDLLIQVAEVLKSVTRETDLVCRLGGDEFLVALKGVKNSEDAIQVATHLITKIKEPFLLGDKKAHINTSIGISIFPDDTRDGTTLIKNADTAMYLSKEKGKGVYSFYTKELDEKAQRRIFLETNLREALEENQFELVYQPQVLGDTKMINGFEALIRWNHPTEGVISPADFIPIAEETNLIVPIGTWVIEETCRQIREWLDAGLEMVTVSVNVSQKQFTKSDLPEIIFANLEKNKIPHHLLKVEITESLLMTDTKKVVATLEELRSKGIVSSIDDFGTGYSSLAYLRKFPITELKIDQSFTRELDEDSSIPQAIISMALSLGLKVVAEGVETLHHNQTLLDLGCKTMQGYVYSKPLSRADVGDMLKIGHYKEVN
ncbi:MAG: EAL domain-containing protein [SAR324 cluster bacterium]|nr:EAL domain-containing protein [SAR324 cluster bacterium]